MFCLGDSGSGKSTLATFAEKLHGVETQGVNTTAVGCRNYLNELRWPATEDGESINYSVELDGALLIFDNVYAKTFVEDKALLGMLLTGHKRGKDAIRIGSSAGNTLKFYTFAPKIISSVNPIYEHPELTELKRRMFVVFHQLWERQKPEDRAAFDWDDVLNLDSVCWDGFSSKVFHPFYWDEDRAKAYLDFKKQFSRCKKPESFGHNRGPLCCDFAATGYLIGAWKTPKDAVSVLDRYWQYLDSKMSKDSTALGQYLRTYVEAEDGNASIKSNDLKAYIDMLVGNGSLLARPKTDEIIGVMGLLGYSVHLNKWRKM
jgi:hypothetical protein